ncbi:hypothetical protein HDU93_009671 [Gonapodya sp. JEL0774]|nr:hypothetical protein HDU93_009671 [Gonapodya sp. JEL0774]
MVIWVECETARSNVAGSVFHARISFQNSLSVPQIEPTDLWTQNSFTRDARGAKAVALEKSESDEEGDVSDGDNAEDLEDDGSGFPRKRISAHGLPNEGTGIVRGVLGVPRAIGAMTFNVVRNFFYEEASETDVDDGNSGDEPVCPHYNDSAPQLAQGISNADDGSRIAPGSQSEYRGFEPSILTQGKSHLWGEIEISYVQESYAIVACILVGDVGFSWLRQPQPERVALAFARLVGHVSVDPVFVDSTKLEAGRGKAAASVVGAGSLGSAGTHRADGYMGTFDVTRPLISATDESITFSEQELGGKRRASLWVESTRGTPSSPGGEEPTSPDRTDVEEAEDGEGGMYTAWSSLVRRSPEATFRINKGDTPVALIVLLRPAFRLGEAVTGTVAVILEIVEAIDPSCALREEQQVTKLTSRKVAEHRQICINISLRLTWRLRVEFLTGSEPAFEAFETVDPHVTVLQAPRQVKFTGYQKRSPNLGATGSKPRALYPLQHREARPDVIVAK